MKRILQHECRNYALAVKMSFTVLHIIHYINFFEVQIEVFP